MNCMLVPTLAMDISLLDRLADSIDCGIDTMQVINNGKPHALDEWQKTHPQWSVYDVGKNWGVSVSWNTAAKLLKHYDSCLVVNDDWQFQPGHLALMCQAADEHPDAPTIHFTQSEGYNCFVWNRIAVEKIGLFDENFYPAYFEDYDYRIRSRLAGLKPHIIGLKDSDMVHGKPRSGGDRYRKLLDSVDVIGRDYFLRKWGAISDRPNNLTFQYPFNNPKYNLKYWEIEPDMREELLQLWNEFVNTENPSIYL